MASQRTPAAGAASNGSTQAGCGAPPRRLSRSTNAASANDGEAPATVDLRPGKDVLPVRCGGEKELAKEFDAIHKTLSDQRGDWSNRMTALKRLQALVLGSARVGRFVPLALRLREPLVTQVQDLRSAIVREACSVLFVLAHALGAEFEPFAIIVLPALFKICFVSVQVIADSGFQCARTIVRECHTSRVLATLLDQLGSRNGILRFRCTQVVLQALRTYPAATLERHADPLEAAIRQRLDDARDDVRACGRKCFWAFGEVFEERSSRLFVRLDATKQRLLENDRPPPGRNLDQDGSPPFEIECAGDDNNDGSGAGSGVPPSPAPVNQTAATERTSRSTGSGTGLPPSQLPPPSPAGAVARAALAAGGGGVAARRDPVHREVSAPARAAQSQTYLASPASSSMPSPSRIPTPGACSGDRMPGNFPQRKDQPLCAVAGSEADPVAAPGGVAPSAGAVGGGFRPPARGATVAAKVAPGSSRLGHAGGRLAPAAPVGESPVAEAASLGTLPGPAGGCALTWAGPPVPATSTPKQQRGAPAVRGTPAQSRTSGVGGAGGGPGACSGGTAPSRTGAKSSRLLSASSLPGGAQSAPAANEGAPPYAQAFAQGSSHVAPAPACAAPTANNKRHALATADSPAISATAAVPPIAAAMALAPALAPPAPVAGEPPSAQPSGAAAAGQTLALRPSGPANISALLTHCSPSTQMETLSALARAARSEGPAAWEKHFKRVLILVLDSLGQDELQGVRDAALDCLQEMLAGQPSYFDDYAEVVASKLFETYRSRVQAQQPWGETDFNGERTASTALELLMGAVDPARALEILLPVIGAEGPPLLQVAMRILGAVLQRMPPHEVMQQLEVILPGVVAAFESPSADVRKAAVFCLVDVYMILGEQVMPFLAKDLTPSQLKLVNIYIGRQQREREEIGPPAFGARSEESTLGPAPGRR